MSEAIPELSRLCSSKELERHGVDATLEELAALPLAVELSDDVEAERVAQVDAKSETDR